MVYILFFIGFVFLIKGADYLVDGASALAKKIGVSTLVIGLTIVAFGTSAPELVVNIIASVQQNTDLAIGNIIGSNISNILLVLGITAFIYPLKITTGTAWKEIPFSLLATAAVFFIVNDVLINTAGPNIITRSEGLILLSFFIIFIYYTFGIARVEGEPGEEIKELKWYASVGAILGGLIGLTIGGKWVVDGAIAFATMFGLSEAFIGLTVVAIGTSLPELATSIVAAHKKKEDIAIGNIVGSNVFNLLWILGLSSVIQPIPFNHNMNIDIIILAIITFILFAFIFISRKKTVWLYISRNYVLERWQGLLFVLLYVAYLGFLIYRG